MLVPPGRYPIDMLAVSLPVRRSELRDPVDAGSFCLSLLPLLLLSDVTTSIDSLLVFWPFFVLNLFPYCFPVTPPYFSVVVVNDDDDNNDEMEIRSL